MSLATKQTVWPTSSVTRSPSRKSGSTSRLVHGASLLSGDPRIIATALLTFVPTSSPLSVGSTDLPLRQMTDFDLCDLPAFAFDLQ
jgi:hypothetical protein